MMKIIEKQKREQETALKEGYCEMAEENKKITKEWSVTDKDWE